MMFVPVCAEFASPQQGMTAAAMASKPRTALAPAIKGRQPVLPSGQIRAAVSQADGQFPVMG